MIRTGTSLALTGAILVGALGLTGCAASEEDDGTGGRSKGRDIAIGASLELSGPTQSIGTAYKKALELQVDSINEQGGVLGGRKLRLVVKDNQTKPAQNITNVNDLINNDHVVAVITGGCSACTVPVTSIVEKRKVPLISLASATAITDPVAERQYTFKISPNPAQDAEVLLADLKKKGVKSVGLLNVDNPYGQEGRAAVLAQAKKAGIEVTGTQQFGQEDKDMSVQAKRLVDDRPEAVVVWAVMPAAGSSPRIFGTRNSTVVSIWMPAPVRNSSSRVLKEPRRVSTWSSPASWRSVTSPRAVTACGSRSSGWRATRTGTRTTPGSPPSRPTPP